jgi:putative transposase
MPRGKKFTAEQIIGKLREAEVGVAQGKTVPEVVRKLGVTAQTYYRWKREYGGLRTDQAKRLKDLEKENARLKRRRLWLGDGSCIRLRPTHRNHVWSFRLVMDRTSEGRAFRMLTIVDEFTRECLAIDVSRKLTSEDVLERLSDLFVRRGVPDQVRSDTGSEFTSKRVREWLERVGVKTLDIEPGSP